VAPLAPKRLDCLIIADDFTGSCDTGLQFAGSGLRTVVLTCPANMSELSELDVLSSFFVTSGLDSKRHEISFVVSDPEDLAALNNILRAERIQAPPLCPPYRQG